VRIHSGNIATKRRPHALSVACQIGLSQGTNRPGSYFASVRLNGAYASSFGRTVNNRFPSVGERFQASLLMGAQLARMLNLNPPVIVLNNPGKLEPEHLRVNVGVALGGDPFFPQNLHANVDMTLTRQALHTRGLCAGCVQKVT
jgi:hypothetical protein